MAKQVIEVPALTRQRAMQLGERGERWLAELPDLVAELARRWAITLGPMLPGGNASLVTWARTADSGQAVLKVAIPESGFADQVRTIAAARGRGYVGLLAHDLRRHAMLQEALGPAMADLGLSPERAIALLCQTLSQAWTVPRPEGATVAAEQEKAAQLGRMVARLWDALGRPCPERVVAQALRFARQRAAAFNLDGCVVVHGDPHPGNALRVPASRAGAESGFVFVDPDGFLADPTYDLGVVLRDWCPQLLAGDAPTLAERYCRLLASETGLDETAIWNGDSSNECQRASTSAASAPPTSPNPSSTPQNASSDPSAAQPWPLLVVGGGSLVLGQELHPETSMQRLHVVEVDLAELVAGMAEHLDLGGQAADRLPVDHAGAGEASRGIDPHLVACHEVVAVALVVEGDRVDIHHVVLVVG
ncbi:MAG TPA: aminoglycoside phosphotransferase family protein [Actinomycetes bacterium]|nr:aminoglycoside phosphotransferase family protein [Actinomycetes bacterium]